LAFRIYFCAFNYTNFPEVGWKTDIVIPFDYETAASLYNGDFSAPAVTTLRDRVVAAINSTPTTKFIKTLTVSPKERGLCDFVPNRDDNKNVLEYLYRDSRCKAMLQTTELGECNGILVRDWNDDITNENQVRMFVINFKLVGISRQSPHYSTYLDYLVQSQKDTILYNIQSKLVDKIKHMGRYCADVSIAPNGEVTIIEVNPFYEFCKTGYCLFEGQSNIFNVAVPPFLV